MPPQISSIFCHFCFERRYPKQSSVVIINTTAKANDTTDILQTFFSPKKFYAGYGTALLFLCVCLAEEDLTGILFKADEPRRSFRAKKGSLRSVCLYIRLKAQVSVLGESIFLKMKIMEYIALQKRDN